MYDISYYVTLFCSTFHLTMPTADPYTLLEVAFCFSLRRLFNSALYCLVFFYSFSLIVLTTSIISFGYMSEPFDGLNKYIILASAASSAYLFLVLHLSNLFASLLQAIPGVGGFFFTPFILCITVCLNGLSLLLPFHQYYQQVVLLLLTTYYYFFTLDPFREN
ncbi:hypothetical protein V8F06_006377 [Rhypophila decipiens]